MTVSPRRPPRARPRPSPRRSRACGGARGCPGSRSPGPGRRARAPGRGARKALAAPLGELVSAGVARHAGEQRKRFEEARSRTGTRRALERASASPSIKKTRRVPGRARRSSAMSASTSRRFGSERFSRVGAAEGAAVRRAAGRDLEQEASGLRGGRIAGSMTGTISSPVRRRGAGGRQRRICGLSHFWESLSQVPSSSSSRTARLIDSRCGLPLGRTSAYASLWKTGPASITFPSRAA